MRITKVIASAGLMTALLVGPISTTYAAPETGFYFGGSWGAYKINEGALDDNDDMLKAFGGWQFTNWFAVEGQWTDFNRQNNSGGDRFEGDGWGIAAVFSMPLGDRSAIFGKVGNFFWDSDSSFAGTARDPDGDDPYFGAGFLFGFNRHVGLRLEWERYDIADVNLNAFSAGIQFTF